jgi:hypothetical protein
VSALSAFNLLNSNEDSHDPVPEDHAALVGRQSVPRFVDRARLVDRRGNPVSGGPAIPLITARKGQILARPLQLRLHPLHFFPEWPGIDSVSGCLRHARDGRRLAALQRRLMP